MKQADTYLEQFDKLAEGVKQPSWVFPLRKAGMSSFADTGFPTVNDEDWRFTNVAPIAKLPFRPALELHPDGLSQEQIRSWTFGSLPAHRLVFINGHYSAESSSLAPLEPGVIAMSLAEAMNSHPALLEKHLSRYAPTNSDAFTALNTAFFQDGAFIYVPAGKSVSTPIHLVFVTSGRESGSTAHPRNLIVAEKSSQLTVLETYVGTSDAATFTNVVTELAIGDNAAFEHVKVQDESLAAFHVAAMHAHLGSNSNAIMHSFATGAKLSRNNIRTKLDGPGLECTLNGLYLTKNDQLADHHMVVEHAQPHCASHEYYNGILDGRSKGVFHGRILVRQAAQKTDAKQTNKNLLLSEQATADTKPQLEIYADDVKCTHGATVGQLNEESIFYLRARGIGAKTARRMLIHAFAGEIIERIRNPEAREQLDQAIWERLEANPHLQE